MGTVLRNSVEPSRVSNWFLNPFSCPSRRQIRVRREKIPPGTTSELLGPHFRRFPAFGIFSAFGVFSAFGPTPQFLICLTKSCKSGSSWYHVGLLLESCWCNIGIVLRSHWFNMGDLFGISWGFDIDLFQTCVFYIMGRTLGIPTSPFACGEFSSIRSTW